MNETMLTTLYCVVDDFINALMATATEINFHISSQA
jgi:hypothetical protein